VKTQKFLSLAINLGSGYIILLSVTDFTKLSFSAKPVDKFWKNRTACIIRKVNF